MTNKMEMMILLRSCTQVVVVVKKRTMEQNKDLANSFQSCSANSSVSFSNSQRPCDRRKIWIM